MGCSGRRDEGPRVISRESKIENRDPKTTRWIQIKASFKEPAADFSPFVEIFRGFGIENTVETDRTLTGCVADVEGSRKVAERVTEGLLAAGAEDVDLSLLEDDNWELVWRQFFKPRRIGKRFVVRPTWEEFEAGPEDLVLVLDPGQAFGTGDHPTTRLCLELLEELDLDGQRVLDVGCGSGILSIAAAKLGAHVSACDVDLIALEVTRQNASVNKVQLETWVEDVLGLSDGEIRQDETPVGDLPVPREPESPQADYNLVVSNIISATLIRMTRQVAALVEPGGAWIVSGIIEDNWPNVRAAAEEADFRLITERHEDGWVAARFRRLGVGE